MAVTNFTDITDTTQTKTLLYESIPLTGTVVSGTYGDNNIKDYTHGQFQSVYDYPYLSSSANHIFDITLGYDESSLLSGSDSVQNAKKINMYNQMSQVLLGYTGSNNVVRVFETDLTLDNAGTALNGWFVNLARLITKDQIKKGTFSMVLGTASYDSDEEWKNPFADQDGTAATVTIQDISASDTGGTTNTFGGDYGILYNTTVPKTTAAGVAVTRCGVIFYQAGIVFLSSSAFTGSVADDSLHAPNHFHYDRNEDRYQTLSGTFTGSAITGACDALRHRIKNISFNNTTEINSSIYFCRVPSSQYNHSANPTYLNNSKIRVKSVASDPPIAYITTIGLYSDSNELLAIAKLSEPLRKDPTNELTLRVRLDY